jgi:hypothetical protein
MMIEDIKAKEGTMKKYADIKIELTVAFDDNGEDDLMDQAIEAADDALGCILQLKEEVMAVEVVGEVRDTENPA